MIRTVPSQPIIDKWREHQWKSILILAELWSMTNIRQLAVERLSSCASSATKLLLGKQYLISKWIRDGYLELCTRPEPLNEEEGSKLDWREIIKISAARERIRTEALEPDQRSWEWISTKYGRSKRFVPATPRIRSLQPSQSEYSCHYFEI